MPLLTVSEIEEKMPSLDGWQLKGREIERTFKFKDFVEAMVFVNRVADIAEEMAHHPDIAISWNVVTLTLTTHAQGGLTGSDFKLAEEINGLL